MELGRAGLTPDSQVDLGVVTTPDTLLERDVVSCVVALGEEIDTSVTADKCSVIEGLLADDTSSRDGLPMLSESLTDDESLPGCLTGNCDISLHEDYSMSPVIISIGSEAFEKSPSLPPCDLGLLNSLSKGWKGSNRAWSSSLPRSPSISSGISSG